MNNLDELREKLESLYNESRTMGMLRTGNPMAHMIDGAMELIQQETLKARIDEANNWHRRIKSGEFGNNLYGDFIRVREKLRKRVNYLRKERRELQAQLTTDKSKEK